jgi:phage baseplate assembly protein W
MPSGIGVTLPLRRGKTGYFAQSQTALEQAKSNLVSLLLTRKGERVFEPELGSDLHSLVFTQMDSEYEDNVRSAILRAVNQWLPFLNIDDITVQRDQDNNLTKVQLQFSLASNAQITDTVVIQF